MSLTQSYYNLLTSTWFWANSLDKMFCQIQVQLREPRECVTHCFPVSAQRGVPLYTQPCGFSKLWFTSEHRRGHESLKNVCSFSSFFPAQVLVYKKWEQRGSLCFNEMILAVCLLWFLSRSTERGHLPAHIWRGDFSILSKVLGSAQLSHSQYQGGFLNWVIRATSRLSSELRGSCLRRALVFFKYF